MADEDPDKQSPSLEPPTLGFGRKRRRKAAEPAPDESPTTILDADDSPAASTSPPDPVPAPEPPPPLFADEVEPAPAAPVDDDTTVDASPAGTDVEPEPRAPRARRGPRGPRAPMSLAGGLLVAVLTGAVAGLLIVALTSSSFRLCESLKGTTSCGGPGIFLLVAIMAAAVLLGAAMLRMFHLRDPASTSFLAVGLLCVLTLLFLVDVAFDWWMIIAIPLISMATFALSHWVTVALIDPADD